MLCLSRGAQPLNRVYWFNQSDLLLEQRMPMWLYGFWVEVCNKEYWVCRHTSEETGLRGTCAGGWGFGLEGWFLTRKWESLICFCTFVGKQGSFTTCQRFTGENLWTCQINNTRISPANALPCPATAVLQRRVTVLFPPPPPFFFYPEFIVLLKYLQYYLC